MTRKSELDSAKLLELFLREINANIQFYDSKGRKSNHTYIIRIKTVLSELLAELEDGNNEDVELRLGKTWPFYRTDMPPSKK